MSQLVPPPARPAATVALLRGGCGGCEVLLVQRNVTLSFHGGAWVFPGGRIDAHDYRGGDIVAAARHAAVRETDEETGVTLVTEELVLFSRWITPEISPKRFDTWFFATPADDPAVRIDGKEILAHRWVAPERALAEHRRGSLVLPPPTFVTLTRLGTFRSANDALQTLTKSPVEMFSPRVCTLPNGRCSLYFGDAGYEDGNLDRPGPRHRLWMLDSGWRYERVD